MCTTSPQLFSLQPEEYQNRVISRTDQLDSTVIITQAQWLKHDWLYTKAAKDSALSSDWDDRWRTGENLEDVMGEANLSPRWVLEGLKRFANDREQRLNSLRIALEETGG